MNVDVHWYHNWRTLIFTAWAHLLQPPATCSILSLTIVKLHATDHNTTTLCRLSRRHEWRSGIGTIVLHSTAHFVSRYTRLQTQPIGQHGMMLWYVSSGELRWPLVATFSPEVRCQQPAVAGRGEVKHYTTPYKLVRTLPASSQPGLLKLLIKVSKLPLQPLLSL